MDKIPAPTCFKSLFCAHKVEGESKSAVSIKRQSLEKQKRDSKRRSQTLRQKIKTKRCALHSRLKEKFPRRATNNGIVSMVFFFIFLVVRSIVVLILNRKQKYK